MPELMEKTDSNEKFTAKESKRNVEKGEKKRKIPYYIIKNHGLNRQSTGSMIKYKQ